MHKIFIFLFLAFSICISMLSIRTFWVLSQTNTPDFSVYYLAAKNIRNSRPVYTEKASFTLFAYPLFSGLFYIPFTQFSYQVGQVLFLIFNFLALLGISILLPLFLTNKRSLLISILIFSFSYISFPTKFTLGMGQINLIAYFLLILSLFWTKFRFKNIKFYKYNKYAPLLISIFFVMSYVLKPILGFMFIYFILLRQWNVIIYSIIFSLIIFVFSFFIDKNALIDYFYYLNHVIPEVIKPIGKEIYYSQGFMSFVFRETSNKIWRLIISYLGIAVIFFVGVLAAFKSRSYIYKFSLLLSMIPLVDTLSWQHHFVILIFPFFYAVHTFINQRKWLEFGILCLSYILVSSNIAHPQYLIYFPANFLLSNTFYGALILFLLFIFKKNLFINDKFLNI